MNSHDLPLQSPRTFGALAPFGPKFWGTGAAFLAVYLALNLLTEWHEFDRRCQSKFSGGPGCVSLGA
jgi:hypothetical protein